MVMVLACASMLFSTNSAMALSGLACESAMIRMAFQSSPILNLPRSDSLDLAALVFATMATDLLGIVSKAQASIASPLSVTHYIEEFGSQTRVAPEGVRDSISLETRQILDPRPPSLPSNAGLLSDNWFAPSSQMATEQSLKVT